MIQLSSSTIANVAQWLNGEYDKDTKQAIRDLQENNPKELEESFYTHLEFGTGGLRGIMGVGTNRMNIYTVGFTTQGFANYIQSSFTQKKCSVAIAHDSRNNSRLFAETAANIFSANGIKVYLFESLRPTPELSFAIRYLGCQAGVVCTASHNPKEYNGYKVYWNDGAQVIEPHDKNILHSIQQIDSLEKILWKGNSELIEIIGANIDDAYTNMIIQDLCLHKEVIISQKDLSIVYTPIHGTGITLVPKVLSQLGFQNLHIVPEQEKPDGNFPTVIYPNPEEKEAMYLGLQKAKSVNADLLLGTDPDADRISVGIKNKEGEWMLLNGNQTALIVFDYCIKTHKQKNPHLAYFIAKTIVTTDLIDKIAAHEGVACYNVLTGFKWIASLIASKEGKEKFIVGGEESFGLLIGDKVRDKDAISAVAVICEMAAYYKNQHKSIFDALIDIYQQHGFYYENLLSITQKGKEGKQAIQNLMNNLRSHIPSHVCNIPVHKVLDYESSKATLYPEMMSTEIQIPKSNVLQIILEDGTKISFRPSGTEPKIKYYFSVPVLTKNGSYQEWVKSAEAKIKSIVEELQLNP